MNPATTLRALGPKPWKTGYVEPSIRPTDGRYGENPYRFQHYFQYQVLLKPSPDDVLELYFGSLAALGIDLTAHDLRLVEDDWEQPTLGAWGLGWEVWIDGLEVTQFTYFQQVGGLDLDLIPAEITYGLERLAMFLQDKRSGFDLEWAPGVTFGDVYRENERQWSIYNFEEAPVDVLTRRFGEYEAECNHLVERAAAAPRLRPGAQVLAHLQPARRARRDLGHRARGLHRPRPEPRARRHAAVRGAGGGGCRRCCLRSAARSSRPRPAARRRRSSLRSAWSTSGPSPPALYIGPRRLAVLVEDVSADAAPEWVKGPPVALREKAAAGFAKRYGVTRRGAGGAGRLPRRRGAGQAPRGAARGDPRRARVLQVDAVGGRRASVRPAGAVALRPPRRGRRARRRHLLRAPLHLGPDRDPVGAGLCRDAARERRRAGRGRASGADPRGAARWLARPAREARRGRPSRREPRRAGGRLRRALPRAAAAGDRDGDAVPPALLPAPGRPLRLRRQRRRAGTRDPRERARARGPPRRRDLHVRARPRRRDRPARGPARLDHLLPGRRLVRRQDRAAREARRAARRRRRHPRGRSPQQGRPGLRARARVPGPRGPHRRRVRPRRRLPRGRLRRDRRALPPGRRRRAAAVHRGRTRALRRGQDRQPRRSPSGSGTSRAAPATPTGSVAPRSASAGSRSRAGSRSSSRAT